MYRKLTVDGDDSGRLIVTDALVMAFQRRRPDRRVVHHSDRGAAYTSLAFSQARRGPRARPVLRVHRRLLRHRGRRSLLGHPHLKWVGGARHVDQALNYAELPAFRQPTAWVWLVVEPHRSPVRAQSRATFGASFGARGNQSSAAGAVSTSWPRGRPARHPHLVASTAGNENRDRATNCCARVRGGSSVRLEQRGGESLKACGEASGQAHATEQ